MKMDNMQQNQTCDTDKDTDINDIFDDILLGEEKVIEKAYEEGFKIGVSKGSAEGYHLGYHRGAELGAEIGFYTGIIERYLEYYKHIATSNQEKIVSALEKLKEILCNFPIHNTEEVDIIELANTIRANFKKVCAQCKIDASFPEKDNLSF
ncbi:unnamed protein product [Phaedon cochleariae]|uniref:Uncharacterized protein n=1 Tax=Phaedon cochleariae TaxID=80249 RepID=A0A9N9SAS9_PHACE|nr:unnamed protein product [Phaedon cochleariae]